MFTLTEEPIVNEAATTEPLADISAATMVNDLMSITLDELKQAPDAWQKLTEDEQDAAIQRIENRVKEAVRQAINLVASGGYVRVPATVDAIAIKGEVKATLKVKAMPTDRSLHELFESQGRSCLIVLADAEEFAGQPHQHEADADQLGLALGGIAGGKDAQPDSD